MAYWIVYKKKQYISGFDYSTGAPIHTTDRDKELHFKDSNAAFMWLNQGYAISKEY